MTLYFRAKSGNSLVSITSALIKSHSMANLWATAAAAGQWGQVRVTKTLMLTGDLTSFRTVFVFSERSVCPGP